MRAYGRFQKTQQAATPDREVMKRKQARQALLQRIRKQRAIASRKLAAKSGCYSDPTKEPRFFGHAVERKIPCKSSTLNSSTMGSKKSESLLALL
jgi:hypothetical protein